MGLEVSVLPCLRSAPGLWPLHGRRAVPSRPGVGRAPLVASAVAGLGARRWARGLRRAKEGDVIPGGASGTVSGPAPGTNVFLEQGGPEQVSALDLLPSMEVEEEPEVQEPSEPAMVLEVRGDLLVVRAGKGLFSQDKTGTIACTDSGAAKRSTGQ